MQIAVLGTGVVGRVNAERLVELGHDVVIGTRDPDATMARSAPDGDDAPAFREWLAGLDGAVVRTFAEAAEGADLVINATGGAGAVQAVSSIGDEALAGTVVIDISNPLDFSQGWPPRLTVAGDDSLGEQVQRAVPSARVVKTLNTVNVAVMVRPQELNQGDHTIFMSGDDDDAKQTTADLLRSYGWTDIVDLGDISTARGTEMYLALWTRTLGAMGHPNFNIKVVRPD